MSARASGPPGAVLLRSTDAELQLQGLRTALSLAMGDRPAALFLAGDGLAALRSPEASEAGENLVALPDAGVAIAAVDDGAGPLPYGARRISRRQLLAALAEAGFQQTF